MNYFDCTIEGFIRKASNKRIICYGAGGGLRSALDCFEFYAKCHSFEWNSPYLKIEKGSFDYSQFRLCDHIDFLVDSDIEKWGKVLTLQGKNMRICSPEKLFDLDKNTILLITSIDYCEEIERKLNKITQLNDLEYVISSKLSKNHKKPTVGLLFAKILWPALLVFRGQLEKKGVSSEELNSTTEHMLCDMNEIINRGGVIIPSIGFKITTKCTLQCKYCIDLIPLYPKADHCTIEQVLQDIDSILSIVDMCMFIHLVSGETLLYPQLDLVLKKLIESDKVYSVNLTTNASTWPINENVIPYMQNDKVTIAVSDYGDIEKMARIVSFCERNKINCWVVDNNQKWMDTGRYPKYRGEDKEKLKAEFEKCSLVQDCPTLMQDSHFFSCGKTAKFYDLSAYESDHDYAVLSESDSLFTLREKIMRILFLDYLEGCNYCDVFTHGHRNGQKVWVEAGTQINSDRKRSEYTLTKRTH